MIPTDQVLEGDSITLLADVPDQSVTAMITDPPYPNGMNLFTEDLGDGLAMLYLATKKVTGHIVFFWRASDVPRPPPGWYEIARHLWHKPDSNSRVPYEAIVVWNRERKNERCRFWSIPLLSLRSLGDWKPHPTQKPVQLLRYLVEAYTKEGDTVFDPFVGSGTTAIACQQLKRHFIAIEKNPEFVAIARERLQRREQRIEERRQRIDDYRQRQAQQEEQRPRPDGQASHGRVYFNGQWRELSADEARELEAATRERQRRNEERNQYHRETPSAKPIPTDEATSKRDAQTKLPTEEPAGQTPTKKPTDRPRSTK